MNCLPIVERELRLAARRGWTFGTRLIGAGLFMLIAGGFMLINLILPSGAMGNQLGTALLFVLEWLSFVGVLSAGVFLTADCLSGEKREGTLGLLFLTDLRGPDVVLGKLLATSLRAAQGLVAVFPILGLPLLLGGVTGGEFWRIVLGLANTLFLSLTLGLAVSAASRDALKAMTGTLLGLALVLFGPLLLDSAWEEVHPSAVEPLFALGSPGFALAQAGASRLDDYWLSLAVTHALGWGLLGLACYWVPRTWQQKTSAARWNIRFSLPVWLRPNPVRRAARRTQALDRDPVAWLAARDPWLRRVVPVFVYGGLGLVALTIALEDHGSEVGPMRLLFFYVLAIPFGLWVAAQASRFFTEGRRMGLFELLLATPVTGAEVVRGHWTALRRLFLLPALALLVLLGVVVALQAITMSAVFGPGPNRVGLIACKVVAGLLWLGGFGTGLGALAWFGMWMGLTSRTTTVAVLKTMAFVKVLPTLALWFMQAVLMEVFAHSLGARTGLAVAGEWIEVLPSLILGVIWIGVDVVFIVEARRKVAAHFREYVSLDGRIEFASMSLPPRLVPPGSSPPPSAA